MPTLKQRLEDLMREKKTRATAQNVGLTNQAPTRKEGPDRTEASSRGWLDFINLSDEKLEKKLKGLPEDEMLELYKKLEREVGLRIDPENYKRHKIVKNFILLWTRKKEDERRKAARGEELIPLTDEEKNRIWGDGSRGIARRSIKILGDEPF